MSAFWAMVTTSFASFFRNRSALFFGVAFPLILMGLIGVAFSRTDSVDFTVAVVDEGAPQIARSLLTALRGVPVFTIIEEGREAALDQLRQGNRALVVILPASGSTLQVYYDSSREQTSRTALLILERFIAEANLRLTGTAPYLQVTSTAVAGAQTRFFDFLLPGILAMTIAQTGLMRVSTVIAEMRGKLVLKRVMATPVAGLSFVGGLIARDSLIMLIQSAIILVMGVLVFGARVQGSLLQLTLLAVVGSVAFFGMGFAISTISRSSESANLLGSLVNFPMMFLAGTFWPRDFMPEAIRPVIAYLPLSPLVDAMRGVAAYGENLSQYGWAILYLIGWTAVSFFVAVRRFRWE